MRDKIKEFKEQYHCLYPIYIKAGLYARCFKCDNCKKFRKKLNEEIKIVINIPDCDENGEPIC